MRRGRRMRRRGRTRGLGPPVGGGKMPSTTTDCAAPRSACASRAGRAKNPRRALAAEQASAARARGPCCTACK